MPEIEVISLTRKLISFNSINPPGNEGGIARFVGELLAGNGFSIEYLEFGENRLQLIAEKGLSPLKPPVVLSGHFDTVPLGSGNWNSDPFKGEIKDGKIFGRGSSDMKAGLAAMICAAVKAFKESFPAGGIRLIFTADEEPGCLGVQKLVKTKHRLGTASAIIVGEPTANLPAIGHKGALYLSAITSGKTAHSSMPELGDNAIYKAARAILIAKDFSFAAERDDLLGLPTINVGKMSGGININSVPDHAEFSIDIRSTTRLSHNKILTRLKEELGNETNIKILADLKPVSTDQNDPFVQLAYDICGIKKSGKVFPLSLPYVTDGSVLQSVYGGVPTLILGPGQPELAHQTDEFCYIEKIEQSVNLYLNIILKWSAQ
jgi:succinyl-diaminopimelate desuccinylase